MSKSPRRQPPELRYSTFAIRHSSFAAGLPRHAELIGFPAADFCRHVSVDLGLILKVLHIPEQLIGKSLDVAACYSFGSSLLPTMVMFMPICTDTGTPSTSMAVLPFRYQPREPVENSLTSASSGTPLMVTVTGFAFERNCGRLIGQVVFAMSYSLRVGTRSPD